MYLKRHLKQASSQHSNNQSGMQVPHHRILSNSQDKTAAQTKNTFKIKRLDSRPS